MTTSGVITYNDSRDTIIADALSLINVASAEDTIQASDSALALRVLNRMIKSWDRKGAHVWATPSDASLFLVPNQASYSLGNAVTDAYATNSAVETTLSAAALISATSLTLTSTTGMTVGDYIGIELDTGALHWTTIATIPTSTSATINLALTGAAASANVVYTFTTRITRPLRMDQLRIKQSGDTEIPMLPIASDDYFAMPNKLATGLPINYYYSPELVSGTLYIWPVTTSVKNRIKFSYRRTLQDYVSATDTSDLPQEWLECIILNLAVKLAPHFGKYLERDKLLPEAAILLEDCFAYDQEPASISFRFNDAS